MQGLPLKPGGGWDMAYENIDPASKISSLQEENRAINNLDITSEYHDNDFVCSYGPDGILVVRCPAWEDDRGVCCGARAHFGNRVKIGELRMISHYAKLLQDPKSAVANPCASLPWALFYGEKYVH
jgi:hypothetical protein